MIYQYLGRKLVCLCWLLNIICVKVALPAKNQFLLKMSSNFSHNLRMSHQKLKKIQEFKLTTRETKYVKSKFLYV